MADPRKGGDADEVRSLYSLIMRSKVAEELRREQIDIVVGRWKWEQRVIERAETTDVQGIPMRVPLTSDLILLKLAAGGPIDQQDVIRLLAVGPRDRVIEEVNQKIGDLPEDASALWKRLVTDSSS